jgi:hypothetical protein
MSIKMDKAAIKALERRQRHPELHMKETDIDRHNCKRVVPMEVLSLGMSRTGTSCNLYLCHFLHKAATNIQH